MLADSFTILLQFAKDYNYLSNLAPAGGVDSLYERPRAVCHWAFLAWKLLATRRSVIGRV